MSVTIETAGGCSKANFSEFSGHNGYAPQASVMAVRNLPRISEVVLVLVLIIVTGFVRVYVGKSTGILVVWKPAFTYDDTFVSLDALRQLPNQEKQQHSATIQQLEDMGLMDEAGWNGTSPHKHHFARSADSSAAHAASPAVKAAPDVIAQPQTTTISPSQ